LKKKYKINNRDGGGGVKLIHLRPMNQVMVR